MKEFYMRWREDFDDQEGWFKTEQELKDQVQRIRTLEADDGESCIYMILYGQDVTCQQPKEKLVRDNMPKICKTKMSFRVASHNEIPEFLAYKLVEEANEALVEFEHFNRKPFDRSKDKLIEELADLKEVIKALELTLYICEEVEQVQAKKLNHRGGFKRGIIWDGNK